MEGLSPQLCQLDRIPPGGARRAEGAAGAGGHEPLGEGHRRQDMGGGVIGY